MYSRETGISLLVVFDTISDGGDGLVLLDAH